MDPGLDADGAALGGLSELARPQRAPAPYDGARAPAANGASNSPLAFLGPVVVERLEAAVQLCHGVPGNRQILLHPPDVLLYVLRVGGPDNGRVGTGWPQARE